MLLLKFPYPYRAAVTVCSDTHATAPERFEAVHRLVNTRETVLPGSELWKTLFYDPEIERLWPGGIEGFGLPIADSFWLYDHRVGVFEKFDRETGRPVPNRARGLDWPAMIDRWLESGWVDTLHTPGQGPITREATAAGLEWLAARPHGRVTVWVNHSVDKTPTCIEPDPPALRTVVRNLARVVRRALGLVGLDVLGRQLVSTIDIRSYPVGQRAFLGALTVLLAASLLWSPIALVAFGLGWRSLAGLAVLMSTVLTLSLTPVEYAQGDNPGSPHYVADLARNFGFRFYWMVENQPGYVTHVSNTLMLPEAPLPSGRSSFFRVVALDDRSRVLVFPRAEKISLHTLRSAELLTEEALGELLDRQGTSIIYTHWTIHPPASFTLAALQGLDRLRRLHEDGHVWVAPTSEILRFSFVRAYLSYETRPENGRLVLDLKSVDDPVGPSYVPTLKDLAGISFEGPADIPVEVRLGGVPLADDQTERLSARGRLVVRFPMGEPRQAHRTNTTSGGTL
jgi:hypothetical protein